MGETTMRLHSRFFLYFYFACFAALAFIEPAASQVVVTVTGTVANVTNGNPNSDPPGEGAVFGAAGNLSGDPFTLTMNFDPSEGTNSSASCSDGTINQSSNIGSDASAGPTAVLQIGGGSYTFGNVTPINMGWGITRGASLPPSCSGYNEVGFGLSESYGGTYSGSSGFGNVILYATSPNFASGDWRTAIPTTSIGVAQFQFNITLYSIAPDGTHTLAAYANGYLNATSVTVSGLEASNPLDKDLGACSNAPGQRFCGNPINVGNGNKYEEITDYATAGQNKLSFTRYYNSLGKSDFLRAGPSGTWRTTYSRTIQNTSATSVAAYRADGQVLPFTLNAGAWTTDTDVDVKLTQAGGTWTLTDTDDTVETYTTAELNLGGLAVPYGQLASIQWRNGYTQTLNYGTNNELLSVTDSYGRTLTFGYNAAGQLQTFATPDATTITYAYSATSPNLFTSVTYPTTPATSQTYLYENAAEPTALTGIIDENGNRFATWTYDGQSRALSSQHAGGADLTTISYDDTTGNRTVTTALGQRELYKFSTLQNVAKATEIDRLATTTTAAATETFAYDPNGYVASRTDWDGNVTTYQNDAHGDPTTINEAVGTSAARTTMITYDTTWVHLPRQIVTPGLTTNFTYDSSGEQLNEKLTDTTTTSVPYSTAGQTRTWINTWSNFLLASTQTPNGNTTKLGYDATGALTSITDALDHVTNITAHTGGGLPRTIVDPNGVTTTLNYDPRQRLTDSTGSGTSGTYKTTWKYDAAENLTTTTLPDNSYLTNSYDTAHRLIKVTDSLGNYTSYTLDALGDRTQTSIYNSGGTLTWQDSRDFDALGRLLADTAGAGQVTTRSFDLNGNVLTVMDGLSHATTYAYDALNRLKTSTDANGGVTTPSYDAHDRTISVKDANGNTTAYIRDGFGDVIQQASPDSGSTVFQYDLDANLTSKTDALGIVTNQTFDALDRPKTTTYPAHPAENVAYTYDQTGTGFAFGIGRLTSVTDAAGSLTRQYEERGNLTNETRVNGNTTLITNYTYDGASRVASMTYPDGTLVTYMHDVAGYISNVMAKPSGSSTTTTLATLTHQPFGPRNGVTFGNGIAETWTYDKSYRATSITDLLSAAGFQNLSYAYDYANNVGSITDAVNPANSQALGYDPLNRLVSAASGNGGYGSYSWTYDKVSNRLTQIAGGNITSYAYATGTNRLSTITTTAATAQLRRMPGIPHFHRYDTPQWAQLSPSQGFIPRPPRHVQQPRSFLLSALGWPMLLTGFGGILVFRKRLRTSRGLAVLTILVSITGVTTLLIGCVSPTRPSSDSPTASPAVTVKGMVHGGQQPVAGSAVQLYAVGTARDGSGATPLISPAVLTDANGNFTITSLYKCPSASTQVYLLATGGNPGLASGTNNSAIAMMAALGPCGLLTSSTYIFVDEVTTVGSLAALYPYMASATHLGSGTADAIQLASAFAAVSEYTNTSSGVAPGPALPSGYYASSKEINTLGNIVALCINSAGGASGDGSPCGNLFSLATPQGGTAPTDTIGAVLDILDNPSDNVADIFGLSGASVPFAPSLSAAPLTWSLPIVPIPATPTFLPAPGTYVSGGFVELDDTTAGATIYYTTDGSTPTTNSPVYIGAINVASTETIQAIATAPGNTTSGVGIGTYSITGSPGGPASNVVTVLTNANGNITSIPPADSVAYATFSYNNANRLASVTGSPLAATFVYDWAGQRFSKTDNGSAPSIYSYMQGGTLIAENDGGTTTDYIYADGRPIAILQPGASTAVNQVNYVAADRLGTPQVVTNSSGGVVWSTTYQPFGTTGVLNAVINQNLRFPGQNFDAETSFNYNLNRDYMPNLGRYLETDPIGLDGGMNTYHYVRGNPFKYTDEWGLVDEPGSPNPVPSLPGTVKAMSQNPGGLGQSLPLLDPNSSVRGGIPQVGSLDSCTVDQNAKNVAPTPSPQMTEPNYDNPFILLGCKLGQTFMCKPE